MSDFTIENVERDVSRHEIPFQVKIETYHLTDEQRLGLDPILHAGPDGGLRLCVETGFRRCAPTSLAR